MFKCTDCQKVVRKVEDIRNCSRCQSNGSSASIHERHQDSDWLTPAIIGYALGGGFLEHTTYSTPEETPSFSRGGGETAGGGASASWSDDSSSSSPDSSSSDSSSSDSGSSSSDSGSSSSSSD